MAGFDLMSQIPGLNITALQKAQIIGELYGSTTSDTVPALLLESFLEGVVCACVPIGTYLIWVARVDSRLRGPFISLLWIFLIIITMHWTLSLRQLQLDLTGSPLGIFVSADDIDTLNLDQSTTDSAVIVRYMLGGLPWTNLFPLVTETVLLGFASSLFAIAALLLVRSPRSEKFSPMAMIIPAMALSMYGISVAHWAISLCHFLMYLDSIAQSLTFILLVLFSVNTALSDMIVLWRMCVVWNGSRSIRLCAAVLLVAILGLNIANVEIQLLELLDPGSFNSHLWTIENIHDLEIIGIYGNTFIGIGAVFISLTSNTCATVFVGIKAWLHRKQFKAYVRSVRGRTLAQRVMEILVESGVVYTAIWLLYCISFFQPIKTEITVKGLGDLAAASYLDAAMAQITSIYPLTIFILIALDKIHHSRGPDTLRNIELPQISQKSQHATLSVPLEVDIEHSTTERTGGSMHST